MEDLLNVLSNEVKRICKDGSIPVSTFVRDVLKSDILRVKLPSTYSILKLKEESSPELNLRIQQLKELIDEKEKSQIKCDTKEIRQKFLEDRIVRSCSLLEDHVLEDAYGIGNNGPDRPDSPKAKIDGVVLRRSPKYVSMISLDGSKEFLVEIAEPFQLLEVKIKVGDVLSVIVNPDSKKTKDLNPELIW